MRSVCVLVLATVAGLGPDRADAAGIPTGPVHTNKQNFGIPFRYDPAEMQRLGAREVRLFVSTDQGVRWQHVDTVAPDAARFRFHAARDGEYWFAVRTLDRQNRLHPQGPSLEPGLRVVVDTQPPVLDIQVAADGPGRVGLTWRADDPHLDLESLELEYVQNGGSNWSPVAVRSAAEGKTGWSLGAGGTVAVRGRIADRAENMGRAQSQAAIAPSGGEPESVLPEMNVPIAGTAPWDGAGLFPETFPGDEVAGAPEPSSTVSGRLISSDAENRPPVTRDRYSTASEQRERIPRKVVNTTRFQIDYKVDDIGPSGVGIVELFITENGGKKWWKYGEDDDRQSPLQVTVPRDGEYGFAIRARSGVGIAHAAPRSGQKPDIIVLVDQTPPVVKLLPLEQGKGENINKLLIRWEISESHPSATPVALAYAEDPTGPWEPITGWQQDSGSFWWTMGSGVPARLHIRLTVRDAAGNLVRAETPQPLIVDLSRPSARIVDVEAGPGRQ